MFVKIQKEELLTSGLKHIHPSSLIQLHLQLQVYRVKNAIYVSETDQK